MAVLHRAHTSGFCSALEQLSHSVALLLSLSAGCVLRPWHLESVSATAAAGVIQIYSRPEYLWKLSIRNDSRLL